MADGKADILNSMMRTERQNMDMHIHGHTLRHTFSIRCVEVGFELKSLSEILCHAYVNITFNRYVHSSFDLKQLNMNKLSLVF